MRLTRWLAAVLVIAICLVGLPWMVFAGAASSSVAVNSQVLSAVATVMALLLALLALVSQIRTHSREGQPGGDVADTNAAPHPPSEPGETPSLILPTGTGHAPRLPGHRPLTTPPPNKRDVPRPQAMSELTALVSAPGARTVGLTTALRGAGGFGKTTLAKMFVNHPDTRELFPDGVLWVDLGEDIRGPDLAEKVNRLTQERTGSKPRVTTPGEAGTELAQALGDARLLLIIDDVWDASQLEPFLHGGPQVVRLVTTRNSDALPDGCRAVTVDRMTVRESTEVLLAGLPGVPEALVDQLLRATGRWAVLLSLVNATAVADLRHGRSAADTLTEILVALQEDGPSVLDISDEDRRDRAAAATIEVSLRRLTTDERQRYLELAVFAEDIDIPLPTLDRYWLKTGGWDRDRVRQFCRLLAERSLVISYQEEPPRVRLHDVFRSYLCHLARHQLRQLHARLVKAHRDLVPVIDGAPAWWLMPHNDAYCWQWLATHLHSSGSDEEIRTVLRHPDYLVGKLETVGPAGLQSDLALLHDPTSRALHDAVVQTAHLLAPLDPPGSLRATLGAILRQYPDLDDLAEEIEGGVRLPSLRPFGSLPGWSRPDQADGHTAAVRAMTASRDGTRLITASDDATIQVIDPHAGHRLRTLVGHTGPVRSLAYAPDGTWLASGSYDRTVRIWDPDTGRCRRTLTDHGGMIVGLAVPADGSWLACLDYAGTVSVCRPLTGERLAAWKSHAGFAEALAVAPDGSWLATGSHDGAIHIWNPLVGEILATLAPQGAEEILALGAVQGGEFLASLGDGQVRIWQTSTWTCRHVLATPEGRDEDLLTTIDAAVVVTLHGDGSALIWDASSGSLRHTIPRQELVSPPLTLSSDGTWLTLADQDGSVQLWSTDTARQGPRLTGLTVLASRAAVPATNTWLAASAPDGSLAIWNPATGRLRHTLQSRILTLQAPVVIPGSRQLVTGTPDGRVELRSPDSCVPVRSVRDHTCPVTVLAAAPSGRFFASAGVDGRISIRDPVSGDELRALTGHRGIIATLAISADDTWLAAGGSDMGRLWTWDPRTGEPRATLSGGAEHRFGTTWTAATPRDRAWLATAGYTPNVLLWEPAAGRLRHALEGHTRPVQALATPDDGSWLASASHDRTVRIWDPVTGTLQRLLTGQEAPVGWLAAARDGRWLAAADYYNSIRIWNPHTGALRHTLRGHQMPTKGLAAHPHGALLATASHDQTVRLWNPIDGTALCALRLNSPLNEIIWWTPTRLAIAAVHGLYLVDFLADPDYFHARP